VQDAETWRAVLRATRRPASIAALVITIILAVFASPWVLAAGVPVYALLVAGATRDEHNRLGAGRRRLALPAPTRSLTGIGGSVRAGVVAALSEERAILVELDGSVIAPEAMRSEVVALCDELVVWGRRASDVDTYLRGVNEPALRARLELAQAGGDPLGAAASDALAEQLLVINELRLRRDALEAEINRQAASLAVIRARLVQAQAHTPGTQMTTDISELRDRIRAVAASVAEAYGQNADGQLTKGT
jgi:hypothetical protein